MPSGKNPLRFGLALGGGAAHGLAHIGVLKALEDANIHISYIAGTSVGGLIGASYASGLSTKEMSELACKVRWRDLGNLTFPRVGLISNEKMEDYLRRILPVHTFEEVKTPIAIIATDIGRGEKVVLTTGDLIHAIRATCSIPGIFMPVELDGRILVDGRLVDNLPIATVREMGADVVVAVDVNARVVIKRNPVNIFQILMQSIYILGRSADAHSLENADLVVAPKIGDLAWEELDKANELIEAGEKAMRERLPQLKHLLKPGSHLIRRASTTWDNVVDRVSAFLKV